jgi:PAS domain S-box-containing protein
MSDPTTTSPQPRDAATVRGVIACFAVVAAVLLGVVFVAVRNLNRTAASADWVNHTHAVILAADGVLSELHAGDGALRTFAMTADARDQAASREAFAAMGEHLEIAKALTRSESAQNVQVVRLETLVATHARRAGDVFAAWPRDRNAALALLLGADAPGATTAEIRRAVARLKDDEMALLAARDTEAFLQAQTTRWTVWTGVALDFILLAGAAWLIRDALASRRRAATALAEANAQLDAKVRERTADLAAANDQLATENLERRWANQALEHQLRYHQLIVNAINDPVFVITKALNISRVNPAAVYATGFEPAELINRPLAEFVKLAGEAAVAPMAQALREGRDLRDLPAILTEKRGRASPVSFTLYPVRDGDKIVGGVVVLELSAS